MMPVRLELRKLLRNPLFAALYLPGVLFDFSLGLLDPVLPLYARSLAGYGLAGLALAAEGLGTLIFDLPAGLIAGRIGRKGSMLVGLAGSGLSCVALFWTRSIPQVIGCRLAYGAFRAIFLVSAHVYATDRIATASRGRSLAVLGGMRRIGGGLVGPTVGGAVAAALGLRVPFLLIAAVSAVTMVLVALFVEDGATVHREVGAVTQPRAAAACSRAEYGVWTAAGLGQLLGQLIRTARRSIIPLYAADVLGLNVGLIGSIMGISAAVDVAVFYASGVIMDRWGRKYVTVPTFALQALGILLVPLTRSFAGLLFAATVVGFGNGIGSGSMMTLGSDLAPEERRAEFLGIWRLLGDAGQAASPVVVGGIAELFVLPAAASVVACSGFLAAAIFALLVPETLRKERVTGTPARA